ncbi:MAG: biotin/lipoyl-containing protein [Acidobacteriota bacterium]|nr:biotin/lipoyl-containing protein [Acidobacteriota bacterium]
MDLIVSQGDRQEEVRVERTPEGYRVRVGETEYQVASADAGAGLRSLLIQRPHQDSGEDLMENGGHGEHYEVSVYRQRDSSYLVEAGGCHPPSAPVSVADPLTHLARETMAAAGVGGTVQVTAYMPGRVTAVLVEEGAEVTEGQGVLVLEAMKMENEIAAEKDGTLTRILVEEGAAVEGGDPLFEIE